MKLPNSVEIGGMTFRIIVRETTDCWGMFNFDEQLIIVGKRAMQAPKTAAETLRHEMLHAALYVAGVAFMDDYQDEPIVRAIENLFFPAWEKTLRWMIANNPDLA